MHPDIPFALRLADRPATTDADEAQLDADEYRLLLISDATSTSHRPDPGNQPNLNPILLPGIEVNG